MAPNQPYGAAGCRCWAEYDPRGETWYPNIQCPHHGILAGYSPTRTDTGTYRVIPGGACANHPGASTIAGMCALCTRRPEDVVDPPRRGCSCDVNDIFGACAYCEGFDRSFRHTSEPGAVCRHDAEFGEHPHIPNAEGEPVCTPDPGTPQGYSEDEAEGVGSGPRPGSLEWFYRERAERDLARVEPDPYPTPVFAGPWNVECNRPGCTWGRTEGYGDPMVFWRAHYAEAHATTEEERGVLATVRRWIRRFRRGSGCCDRV